MRGRRASRSDTRAASRAFERMLSHRSKKSKRHTERRVRTIKAVTLQHWYHHTERASAHSHTHTHTHTHTHRRTPPLTVWLPRIADPPPWKPCLHTRIHTHAHARVNTYIHIHANIHTYNKHTKTQQIHTYIHTYPLALMPPPNAMPYENNTVLLH